MKFDAVDNIWTVDLRLLSNADRGRIFFERAKQVVTSALADPDRRAIAVADGRFRRDYLVEEIGSKASVTTQNPKIKALLATTDIELGAAAQTEQEIEIEQLHHDPNSKSTIAALQRRVELQAVEITDLRKRLREFDWLDNERQQNGLLPW